MAAILDSIGLLQDKVCICTAKNSRPWTCINDHENKCFIYYSVVLLYNFEYFFEGSIVRSNVRVYSINMTVEDCDIFEKAVQLPVFVYHIKESITMKE